MRASGTGNRDAILACVSFKDIFYLFRRCMKQIAHSSPTIGIYIYIFFSFLFEIMPSYKKGNIKILLRKVKQRHCTFWFACVLSCSHVACILFSVIVVHHRKQLFLKYNAQSTPGALGRRLTGCKKYVQNMPEQKYVHSFVHTTESKLRNERKATIAFFKHNQKWFEFNNTFLLTRVRNYRCIGKPLKTRSTSSVCKLPRF